MFRGILTVLILSLNLTLACTQCNRVNTAFKAGEEIHYTVYYNWGFIWLEAGWVKFSIDDKIYKGSEVFHFKSVGESYKSYDWLYKVRDSFQTYVDKETFQPLWYYRDNSEGGYKVNNKYFFDWNTNQVYSFTENSNKPYSIDTLSVPDCTLDVLSLIYYSRTIDYDALKVDATIPVVSIIDNEVYELYIRYLGREEVESREGTVYKCKKFSALLVKGTIFKGGEDLVVWVTDDENMVPVLVEAKILVGSVKAYVDSYSGLRNSMNAIK